MTLEGVTMSVPKLPKKGAVEYLSRIARIDKIKRKLYNLKRFHKQKLEEIQYLTFYLDVVEGKTHERHNKANS